MAASGQAGFHYNVSIEHFYYCQKPATVFSNYFAKMLLVGLFGRLEVVQTVMFH